MPRSRLAARRGYTLVELVVVLLLMGVVLASFTMLSHRSSTQVAGEAATRFLSGYQAARAEAIAGGRYAVVQFWFDPTTDADSGRTGRYIAAVMPNASDDPKSLTSAGRLAPGAWTNLVEGVSMDPGNAVDGPMPGSAASVGVARTSISCQTICDLSGSSYTTYYFRPSDDPTIVFAVVISQSGQGRLYRWSPSGSSTTSNWQ